MSHRTKSPADSPVKPPKPYPGFQLFAHSRGYWCAKIDGRQISFGPWAWPDAIQYEASWRAALAKFTKLMEKRSGGSNLVAAGHRRSFGTRRRGFGFIRNGDQISITKYLADSRAVDPLRAAMAADSIRAVFDAMNRDAMRLRDYLAGGCNGALPADLLNRVRTIAGGVL